MLAQHSMGAADMGGGQLCRGLGIAARAGLENFQMLGIGAGMTLGQQQFVM